MIEYATTSVELTKDLYPYLYSLCPDDSYQAQVIAKTMVLMNWRRAAIITARNDYSISLSYDIIRHGLEHNISFNQYFIDENNCGDFDSNDYEGLVNDIKTNNYKIIVLIASFYCPPDEFKEISMDDNIWILSESVGDIVQKDKKRYGWLIKQSLIPRFPSVREEKMDEYHRFFEILEDDDECKHIYYDIYDSTYSPFFMDSVNALISAYDNCLEEGIMDCNNLGVLNEYVKRLKFSGLTKDYDLSQEESFPSYVIYRYSEFNNDTNILAVYDESIKMVDCNPQSICNGYYKDSNSSCDIYIKAFYHHKGCTFINISTYTDYIVPSDGSLDHLITLDHTLSVISFIISFILLSILTLTFAMILKHGDHEIIEKYDKMFLMLVLISLMVLSISFNFFVGTPTDLICNLRNWVYFIGMILLLSTFTIKVRLVLLKRQFLPSAYTFKLYSFIIIPMIFLLMLWSSIPNQRPYVNNEYICISDNSVLFYISNVYILIVLSLYISLSVSKYKQVDYYDDEWLRIIFYLITFNISIEFLLNILIKSIIALTIIKIAITSIIILTVWAILFATIIYTIYK